MSLSAQRSFGQRFDDVRVHTSAEAAEAADALGATAFTFGRDVAFARAAWGPDTRRGQQLIAHELAHVAQSRSADVGEGPLQVTSPEDATEREAHRAGEAMVRGEPAQVSPSGGPVVARQVSADAGTSAQPSPSASYADEIQRHLGARDPIAGMGNYAAAWGVLAPLPMNDVLATLQELSRRGSLGLLQVHTGDIPQGQHARLMSAVRVVEWTASSSAPSMDGLAAAAADFDRMAPSDLVDMAGFVSRRRGLGPEVLTALDGLMAMADAGLTPATANPGPGTLEPVSPVAGSGGAPAVAGSAMPSPITPGPWSPPGGQWPGFYIGNQAHLGIAAEYVAAHPADVVRTNYTPMSTLLDLLSRLPSTPGPLNTPALTDEELGLKPDIINLSRLHLYEIKSTRAQAQGAAEAAMYVGLFGRAGVTVSLGPIGEPGTNGALPAPGGVYIFTCPEAGVITYEYRRGRLVPVPVRVPEGSPERRWRWELQPLTPQQQQVMTMTVGTGLLILMMIVLIPVGA